MFTLDHVYRMVISNSHDCCAKETKDAFQINTVVHYFGVCVTLPQIFGGLGGGQPNLFMLAKIGFCYILLDIPKRETPRSKVAASP